MASSYSLFASDFDLTLAPLPGSEISPRTRRALMRLQSAKIPLVIATGRSGGGVRHHFSRFDIPLNGVYVCAFNGSEIYSAWDNTLLCHAGFSGDLAQQVARLAGEFDIDVIAQKGDTAYMRPYREGADKELWSHGMEVVDLDHYSIAEIEPSKIFLIGKHDELERAQAALREAFPDDVEVMFSADVLMEVNRKGVNKGDGLAFMCDYLGVDPACTIAFGDNGNDVPLLKAAGLGVAVANAVPEALEAADRITASCEEDGVARVVEEVFAELFTGDVRP